RVLLLMRPPPPSTTLFPYTTLFRSKREIPLRLVAACLTVASPAFAAQGQAKQSWKSVEFAIVKFNDEAPKSWSMYHTEKKGLLLDRKSTRLNSSHRTISYAVFCLKK